MLGPGMSRTSFLRALPEVTYQQLPDHLRENNIPSWIDVPTIGPVASPMGNTLDRGVSYTPYGDHFLFSSTARLGRVAR
jgi:hypothetical protein